MIKVEWLLIELIVLALLLNIRAIIVLVRNRQTHRELNEDSTLIHINMEEFVGEIEKENEELYQKLVDYIKVKENKLEKRIQLLEHQLVTGNQSLQNEMESENLSNSEKKESNRAFSEIETDKDKVLKLHKQGFAPKQIAKILKMEYGEVDFIVNILDKKKSYRK